MDKQQGIGLSELLLALFLASLMMTALMRQYLSMKQHYHHIQTELEESIELTLVTELLRDSIRKAGFTPCLGIEKLTTVDNRNDTKALIAIETGVEKQSLLHINRMSEHFDTVLQPISPTELLITDREPLNRYQSLLIADCYHAEVQTISHVRHTAEGRVVALSKPLVFVYQPPIYTGKWLEETYSILHHQSNGSLFYRLQHNEELTPAIHALSAHLNKRENQTLLTIILGLEKGRVLRLETMVRVP